MTRATLILLFAAAAIFPQDAIPFAQAGGPASYKIRAGDQLDIKLYYHPELNESIVVRPDGRISLQIAGEVSADGLTPRMLEETLQNLYAKELKRADVTVIVRSFSAYRVFVDGEVGRPGAVNLPTKMTLAQVLAEAGGIKETGRTKDILVIRRDQDGKPSVLRAEAFHRESSSPDELALQPWDIVYVPRSRIANVNRWVDLYIRKNIPITFGLLSNGFLP